VARCHGPRSWASVGIAALLATATGSPDVIVAAIMRGLGLWGGWQIVAEARGEIRSELSAPVGMAA
jgi:hypothetical protein